MKKRDNSLDFKTSNKKFPTEEKCFEKIYKTRWTNGYRCPRCKHKEKWDVAPYKYKCRNCGYQTSVTAGTLFHRTHLPITKWFQAIYYFSIRREKSTAVELQALLDISNRTSLRVYKTIKPMLYCNSKNKLLWNENKLKGFVEIYKHSILINGYNKYVYIAVETNDNIIGRIRIYEYQENKNEQAFYKSFVHQFIDENATIRYRNNRISCPLAEKVAKDFTTWCNGKENSNLSNLCKSYCRMINAYKTKVTFNEILKNILSNNPPPKYNSKL